MSYIYGKSVMNAAGIVINDDGTPIDGVDEFGDDDESDDKSDIKVSVENLERMLKKPLKTKIMILQLLL
jgi:hypothetical protein